MARIIIVPAVLREANGQGRTFLKLFRGAQWAGRVASEMGATEQCGSLALIY